MATEVLSLADRLWGDGDASAESALRLAGHLAEHAWLAEPTNPVTEQARQRVFSARARATSTMARGIFNWAADESTGTPENGA